ncbi:hypothetical protein HGRIS_002505 [Hohenbuehelia grisea]|uniref:Methyltransferase domain-containing protein n=1 Tax=Hohenbuehelia grisea TaxID=104357 RepID=A0ABR3JLL1_9AGAR
MSSPSTASLPMDPLESTYTSLLHPVPSTSGDRWRTKPQPEVPSTAPPRPPRNPARSAIHHSPNRPRKGSVRGRPSTATGTREEITPWEFFPPPVDYGEAAGTSSRITANTSQPRTFREKGILHSTSVPSMSFANFLRRRKSTGAGNKSGSAKHRAAPPRASKTRAHTIPNSQPHPPTTVVSNGSTTTNIASTSTPHLPSPSSLESGPSQTFHLLGPSTSQSQAPTAPHPTMFSSATAMPSQPFFPSPPRLPATPKMPASSPKLSPSSSPISPISSTSFKTPITHPYHNRSSHKLNTPNTPTSSSTFYPTNHKSPHSSHNSYIANNTSPPPPPPPYRSPQKEQSQVDLSSAPRFSTADRTILAELRRNMDARASQFVVKGSGAAAQGGCGGGSGDLLHAGLGKGNRGAGTVVRNGNRMGHGTGPGRRHHPFSKEEVPYPRSYEREVLDHDVWETAFCQQMCGSVTWHVFKTPPTKVLDLGCGTGSWILDCARQWKECEFVGLDVVPLYPNLHQIGLSDFASRITWLQANFLEGLPFPNEEFDYVHIKRIARGVPEDKWDALLEEISRVMKPGAAFEMVEEDLFFPGKLLDSDSDSDSETLNSRDHGSSLEADRLSLGPGSGSASAATSVSQHTVASSPVTPTTSTTALPALLGAAHVLIAPSEDDITPRQEITMSPLISPTKTPLLPSPIPPLPARDVARPVLPPLQVKPLLPPAPIMPPSPATKSWRSPRTRPQSQSRFADSAVSLINVTLSVTQSPTASTKPAKMAASGEGGVRLDADFLTSPVSLGGSSLGLKSEGPDTSAPSFLRTAPKPPPNPRDHTLLELIYNEMHAARFINLAPISLLSNSLGLYFKGLWAIYHRSEVLFAQCSLLDVRTHPPLQWTFPPRPRKQSVPTTAPAVADLPRPAAEEISSEEDLISADRPFRPRQGAATRGRRRRAATLGSQDVSQHLAEDSHEERWVTMRSLLHGDSKYISLDQTQFSAFSPSAKASFPSPVRDTQTRPQVLQVPQDSRLTRMAASMVKSRLPNTTMNLDLNNLNLHLAVRIAEVLACAEAMWEWVEEYQAEHSAQNDATYARGAGASRSRPLLMTTSSGFAREHEDELLQLEREDFDGLMTQFELNMRDEMAVGKVMEHRFGWHTITTTPSVERKQFDIACEKWDQWQKKLAEEELEEQRRRSQPQPPVLPPTHPYRAISTTSRTPQKLRRPRTAQSHTGTPSSVANERHPGELASLRRSGSLTHGDPHGVVVPAGVGAQSKGSRRFSHYDDGQGGLRRSGSLLAGRTSQDGPAGSALPRAAGTNSNGSGEARRLGEARSHSKLALSGTPPVGPPPERRLSRVTRVFVAWKP